MEDLKDRVVVITGSCEGIGLEIAKKFKFYNSKVVLVYFNKSNKQKKSSKKILKKYKFDFAIGLDVTKTNSVKSSFFKIYQKFKKIDILINNAGINIVGDFDKISDQSWQKVIDTNLKGPFICMREIYKYISKNGKVVNLGSVSGQYGGPRTVSYACAKAGVMALTHCFARFAGPKKNISVNCVSPGPIESDMLNLMPKKILNNLKKDLLIQRLGQKEEVANLVCFLSSKQSSFITAQTVGINGGIWI